MWAGRCLTRRPSSPRFAGSANPISAAETLLDQWLGNAKTAVVGKHPLSDFISTSDNGAAFLAIEKEILDGIQSQIRTNNLGLQVEFLGIKRLQLPESVSQSVFDRMTSERKVLADRFQYEGEAEAQRIRSDAETQGGGNCWRTPNRRRLGLRALARPKPPNHWPSSSRTPNWPASSSA